MTPVFLCADMYSDKAFDCQVFIDSLGRGSGRSCRMNHRIRKTQQAGPPAPQTRCSQTFYQLIITEDEIAGIRWDELTFAIAVFELQKGNARTDEQNVDSLGIKELRLNHVYVHERIWSERDELQGPENHICGAVLRGGTIDQRRLIRNVVGELAQVRPGIKRRLRNWYQVWRQFYMLLHL